MSFVGGMASILGLVVGTKTNHSVPRVPRGSRKLVFAAIACCLLFASGGIAALRMTAKDSSLELTVNAWAALMSNDYSDAIRISQRCIKMYEDSAVRLQSELSIRGEPQPSVGGVPNGQAREIPRRGVLNDVATCG